MDADTLDLPELPDLAGTVIERLAGPGARLRDDQQRAIAELLRPGARVLVVQATGWGKSAVYWTATALRRAAGAGPTLVVSPLLSLMRDQVAAAGRAGLTAATLNSGNVDAWDSIEQAVRDDRIDVLLVSPERLANPGFGRRVMDSLAGNLGMLVIDEAHAVSDWGHDFRPDYRRVAAAIQRLNPDTPVLATTATANERVTADVADQLGANTLVLRGPLARSSLQLAVIDGFTPLQRYAWVVENLPRLPGSGIIYALTTSDAERLTEAIRDVHGDSLPVAAYSGALDAAERERLEDALLDNRLKALVATSALGMGYDKPDLGFCVHVGAPPSPVSYYQQVGRAGRGIDHAAVVLLSSTSDEGVWDWYATSSIPDPQQVQRLLDALRQAGDAMSVPTLEAETGLRRGRIELMLKQLAVDGATERVDGGWRATDAPWSYDQQHYDGVLAVRRREADIMRDYARGRRCLMQLLQESLDDPTAAPCGRCSVCTGQLPPGLGQMPDAATIQQVSTRLREQSNVIEPRRMWPGGAFGRRGRIGVDEQVDAGRALIHADAPEWRELLASSFAADQSASDELVQACVAVLARWRHQWAERPEVVVGLAADGRTQLVESLVQGIAQAGRLATAPLALLPGPQPTRETVGSEEAAIWRDRVQMDADLGGAVVLLVVDASSSMWPVTVAGAALRHAGARRVLPLVVHRRA